MRRKKRPGTAHASCRGPQIAESIPPRLGEKNTAVTVAPQVDDATRGAAFLREQREPEIEAHANGARQ